MSELLRSQSTQAQFMATYASQYEADRAKTGHPPAYASPAEMMRQLQSFQPRKDIGQLGPGDNQYLGTKMVFDRFHNKWNVSAVFDDPSKVINQKGQLVSSTVSMTRFGLEDSLKADPRLPPELRSVYQHALGDVKKREVAIARPRMRDPGAPQHP